MSVSSPFIARPVATSLLAVAVLLSSILAYINLPISSLPQVDFPVIQVTTQLPGASSDTMAALVTAPLERQLGQITALTSMASTSSHGLSQVTLQFALDRDINAAGQDVQSAISAAEGDLPDGLPYPPTYAKVNPSDPPIITIALTSNNVSMETLSDFGDTYMTPRLSQVSGVGHVTVQGNMRPAVRIQADLSRLASYGISMETLRTAIADANVTGAKGTLNGAARAYTIGANDQLEDAESYKNVVVAYSNGAPILLKDVAKIVSGLENVRASGRYNGTQAIVIDVQRQPGANIVDTVDRIKAMLPELERGLPAGIRTQIVAERTATIRASVAEVQFTLVLSIGLVIMVVLIFLRTWAATIVAGITLPLSLASAFGLMWYAGFSLDNLSLMALTIATGFVVDDAIVMIENIVRYIEKGLSPMEAAFKGAGEIGFTIISLTVSLIAVFIPLLFMTGIVGRLFQEFALTLTIAVVVSAIVSLTLTPMMCARLLRPHTGHERPTLIARVLEAPLDAMATFYRVTLDVVLRFQGLTLIVAAATFVLTVMLYLAIPKGFLPDQDTGFLTVETQAGADVSFEKLQSLQNQVEAVIRRDPDVLGVVSIVGVGATNSAPNIGHFAVTLKPKSDREATADEIVRRLTRGARRVRGIASYFQVVQDIQIGTRKSRTQYQYVLSSTDPADFSEWAGRMLAALKARPELRQVSTDLQEGGLALVVNVDRVAAGRLGVSMQDVNNALYNAFGQRQVSTIYGQSNQYRVVLEADPAFQTDPSALERLFVPGASLSTGASTTTATASTGSNGSTGVNQDAARRTGQIPLSSFATIERTTRPLAVHRLQQFPAATISFNLARGTSLDQAVAAIRQTSASIGLPSSISGSFEGAVEEFNSSLQSQPYLILAALIVIYIVLGVLYESFIHPLTILSTLPSAGIGALLALEFYGLEFTFVALIGVILLMGIVKKNAIIMIDFALDAERERGMSAYDAIREACLLRFRPIMMTTFAALFGAIPLALGHGPGAELRVPLGITIIGGLLLSQLLTLYTTPVIYLAMERLRERIVRRVGGETGFEQLPHDLGGGGETLEPARSPEAR
ncbi:MULTISPECIES: efflux RND transporter permease subunit [Rhodomicrobium]|uniref:efflux RND transporter permease subunit n=1 Tax=Rhodomicrobium TaxID=1068 RepID=UPI000B4B7CD9|nr:MULTISPECIES: efflux RND transporter permease subunit [Rhodomicrobium]